MPPPPPAGAESVQAPRHLGWEAGPQDGDRARVWLADDSALEAAHTRGVLSGARAEVETFANGASLLEHLAQPGVVPPDLLLLDWLMPGVSGLDVCRFVRERFSPAQLPILVLTASSCEEDLAEAFGAGANDYVTKPARAVDLLARVRTLLQARRDAEGLREREREHARVRAEAEAARVEAEADRTRLAAILSTLEEGVILQDVQGQARFHNAAALRLLGLSEEQLSGRTSADYAWGAVWPDGRPAPGEEHPAMRALRTGRPVTGEVLGLRHTDGRLVWLSVNSQPYFAPDGTTPAGVVSSFFDVTAQREAEAERARLAGEVEAARRRLAALIESAPAIICTFRGPDLVYEMSNPLHQRLVGVDRQLVGRPVREAVPEAVDQGIVALLEGVYRTGEPFVAREQLRRLDRRGDGTLVDAYVSVTYQPARDAAGRVVGVDVFGFEVTEQVQSRQRVEALAARLQQSEERLRRVVEATGTGTWEMEVATETLVADAHFRQLFGLSADEPFTQAPSMIHPDDSPRVARAVADALAGNEGGRYREEYRTVRTPDGRWRWVEARGQAIFGPDGKPTHILGTGVDVTARKAAEAARNELLEALSAQPALNVCVLRGPRHVFEMANALYLQEVAGGRDILGKPLFEALPELVGQGFDTHFTRLLQTGQPYVGREVPAKFYRPDGTLAQGYYHVVHQPIQSSGGTCDSILCIGQDVTDMVRARQDAERLVALERERAGFEQQLIGIVSHDLRNPISAIVMGAAVLLRRPDVEERQRRMVERILSSASRANRLIHDLLDFTQARLGGGLKSVPAPGDFHAVVRQVLEEAQVARPDRAVHLTQTGEGQGHFDADRLSQVVGNLLSNALHYSSTDSVVQVQTRGEPEALVLTVHNVGPPIPPDVLPRLFQPMQRGVGESGVSEVRSVGLGLYIVDQVVRAHGGTVQVTSTPEAGTSFTVRLPRR